MTKPEFLKFAMAALIPRMMCSVSDRYAKLSQTKVAVTLPQLVLEGSAHIVSFSVADKILYYYGNTNVEAQQEFLQEVESLPLPDWYDNTKFIF